MNVSDMLKYVFEGLFATCEKSFLVFDGLFSLASSWKGLSSAL
jgi:hypothetical protein